MRQYDHQKIEKQWQKDWAAKKLYKATDAVKGKDNYYLLTEFPYPSGNLHVGHWYAFAIPDILARFKRMEGKNVMYPIGFDAFGLPAENAAIKRGLNPRTWTKTNIAYMKKQLASMGASFDWSREVQTIDPQYYKWTQWLFLQFFKKGLAYKKETAVNWCPNDKTVLANEQVVDGKCDRCGAEVEQRNMLQWNLKITEYADRLANDLDALDWPSQIKDSQKNWIGKSEGAEIDFALSLASEKMNRVILLHGKGGTPSGDFMLWAKNQLEKSGYIVEIPALPNTTAPDDVEQAEYIQKNCHVDENTIIVGHSAGGLAAMRLLEKIKAGRLVLVATPHSSVFLDGKERPSVSRSLSRGYDFTKIRSNIQSVITLYDNNDPIVPVSDGEVYAQKLHALFLKVDASKGHFNAEKEPSVLMAIRPTIRVFTTRPDTLFGATYLVLAPEHPWVKLALGHTIVLTNNDEVQKYVTATGKKSELERQESKEKTGVKLEGVEAINPATGEKIPVFVADYVLGHYGTGAIMAVPAHDERDQEFAEAFDLPIRTVIQNDSLVDSKEFNGLSVAEAKKKITEKFGTQKTTYKMRDWVVSRQRYWGVPIPVIHCSKCGDVAVPDKNLPVKLPDIKDYLPTGDGKSPLAKVKKFVQVKCPQCKEKAERETDTFDTFVDSSWYFQRYTDPKNKTEFADAKKLDAWMPINLYSGGAEHTTMHLLYSRFWHKAMFDLGLVKDPEPYARRMNRSLIMGPDGQKMSKSRGNVIDPDEVVKLYGADTVRMYLAFIGPYNEVASYPWNPDGVVGVRRFLERLWRLQEKVTGDRGQVTGDTEIERELHKTIKKVSEDIPQLKFNTAIAAMMTFMNVAEKGITKTQYATLLQLLAPFAPHIAEELWRSLKNKKSIHVEKWPKYDASKLQTETVTIVVQINGKSRTQIEMPNNASEADVRYAAEEAAAKWIEGKGIQRAIVVPNRLVNLVLAQ